MTPDTEWQRTFLNTGTEKGLGDLSMMISVVSELLTSRDTYWKERVRKEVEGMKWETNHVPFATDEQIRKCTCSNCKHNKDLDTLLDNLK